MSMKKSLPQQPESAARAALRFLHAYTRAVNLNNSAHQISDALAMEGPARPRLLAEIVLRALSEAHVHHALSDTPLPVPASADGASIADDPRFATYRFLMNEIAGAAGRELALDVARRVAVLSSVTPVDMTEVNQSW